jgi:rhodanese-related sulfurtransferase
MKQLKNTLLLLLTFIVAGQLSLAAESKGDDMSATEVFELVQANRDSILFIDVRDPVEIQFIGFTNEVDCNIPFLLSAPSSMDKDGKIPMQKNPNFIEDVKAALEAKGLAPDATIITMCRSGSARGKPSAEVLRENGFPNAKYVLHGFQGDKLETGLLAGFRLKNGWQNSGLPWGSKIDSEKAYRTLSGN